MKITRYCIVLLVIIPLAAMAAKTEMTYEQYQNELVSVQQREKTAKEQIAEVQAAIEALKAQLSEIDQKITSAMEEKYRVLGITEQDVIAAENEIASIKQSLESLLSLSPEELHKRIKEVQALESRINAIKAKPVSYLWRVRDKLVELNDLLQRVKNAANQPISQTVSGEGTYTVKLQPDQRDCLARIAAYNFIYGDASKWPLLYNANKDIIDRAFERYKNNVADPKFQNPEDLIFPGQVLQVPRGN
jgi:nucleoid-associated protein YgaU